eukprot:5378126-Amphidinium_carterae.1
MSKVEAAVLGARDAELERLTKSNGDANKASGGAKLSTAALIDALYRIRSICHAHKIRDNILH